MVVLNSSYFTFGVLFTRSLVATINLNGVKNIFVVDVGLTSRQLRFFRGFPKVEIIQTDVRSKFNNGGTHGQGWQDSVAEKTKNMRKILDNTLEPLVVIDADCIVVKDFSKLLDQSYDIQTAHRPEHKVPYLLSFVVAQNNYRSKKFIDHWIAVMDSMPKDKGREGPAFCEAVLDLGEEVKIGGIVRQKVSTFTENEFSDSTYIIHLKGNSKRRCKNIRDRELAALGADFSPLIEKYIGWKFSIWWDQLVETQLNKGKRLVKKYFRHRQVKN